MTLSFDDEQKIFQRVWNDWAIVFLFYNSMVRAAKESGEKNLVGTMEEIW